MSIGGSWMKNKPRFAVAAQHHTKSVFTKGNSVTGWFAALAKLHVVLACLVSPCTDSTLRCTWQCTCRVQVRTTTTYQATPQVTTAAAIRSSRQGDSQWTTYNYEDQFWGSRAPPHHQRRRTKYGMEKRHALTSGRPTRRLRKTAFPANAQHFETGRQLSTCRFATSLRHGKWLGACFGWKAPQVGLQNKPGPLCSRQLGPI